MNRKLRPRWMIQRDIEPVLEIEKSVFDKPLPKETITGFLSRRNAIGMVVECPVTYEVVGHFMYELFKKHYGLFRFAVSDLRRGEGFGRLMVRSLVSKVQNTSTKRNRVITFVPEEHLDALCLLRSCGFGVISTSDNGIIQMDYLAPDFGGVLIERILAGDASVYPMEART